MPLAAGKERLVGAITYSDTTKYRCAPVEIFYGDC